MSIIIAIFAVAIMFAGFGVLQRGTHTFTHCDTCTTGDSPASCHHCGCAARPPESP